jgi:hypothetical protein
LSDDESRLYDDEGLPIIGLPDDIYTMACQRALIKELREIRTWLVTVANNLGEINQNIKKLE